MTVVEGAAVIDGDSALLVSMVGNALDNALKFSQQAVSCTQTARARRSPCRTTVPGSKSTSASVCSCRSIAALRPARTACVGRGIGLALIAHVASLHGGVARFVQAARGARLEIELPLANEP
ncbi:MAG TPA: ATP-binding protein [Polyangiales bacterium]|nr:ATP-binding protein [Polyangiales bacterium]